MQQDGISKMGCSGMGSVRWNASVMGYIGMGWDQRDGMQLDSISEMESEGWDAMGWDAVGWGQRDGMQRDGMQQDPAEQSRRQQDGTQQDGVQGTGSRGPWCSRGRAAGCPPSPAGTSLRSGARLSPQPRALTPSKQVYS